MFSFSFRQKGEAKLESDANEDKTKAICGPSENTDTQPTVMANQGLNEDKGESKPARGSSEESRLSSSSPSNSGLMSASNANIDKENTTNGHSKALKTSNTDPSKQMDKTTTLKELASHKTYKTILTEALNKCAFTLTDDMIDTIGQKTLEEMQRIYNKHGIEAENDFLQKSKHTIHGIKETNRKRRFQVNANSINGRYSNIPKFHCTNINITDATVERSNIFGLKDFVSDFGTEKNKFCYLCFGHKHLVGEVLDPFKDELSPKRRLAEGILNDPYTLDLGTHADACLTNSDYIHLDPIEIAFYFHNPSKVESISNNWETDTFTFQWQTSEGNKRLEGQFPYIKARQVRAELQGEFEFKVTKSYVVRQWAKWTSLGINAIWDETKTNTYTSKQFNFDLTTESMWFKVREKTKIDVGELEADQFIEKQAKLRQISAALHRSPEVQETDKTR